MSNEELVAEIQAGAPERMGELWEQVRLFVIKQARRVPLDGRADCEFDDLIQSGYLALADAVASYEPGEHGFLTHLSYHLKTQFAIATRFRSERQQRETLAGALSLDAPVNDEAGASTFGDFQTDPTGLDALEDVEEGIFLDQLRKAVADALATLPEEQRELLRLRYWEEMTLEEIGRLYGVGIESVRQREKKALRALWKPGPICGKLIHFYDFDYYSGSGLGTFRSTGASIQERYLMKQDRIREREVKRQARKDMATLQAEIEKEAADWVAQMSPEEKQALLKQYGLA